MPASYHSRPFMPALLAIGLTAPLTPLSAQAAELQLEDFFKGRTYAFGEFRAINGADRNFRVDLNGRWDGKTLTLREDFSYDDGEKDRKTWRFTKTGDNTYRGTREDVIGTTTVKITGNTARFSYTVDLDEGPEKNIVRFRDKLVLKDDGTLRNTATVFKFGVPVGRVQVNFAQGLQQAKAIRP